MLRTLPEILIEEITLIVRVSLIFKDVDGLAVVVVSTGILLGRKGLQSEGHYSEIDC